MTCDPWPVDRTLLPTLPDEGDEAYDLAILAREDAIKVAISILWSLSGRRFGICETVVRPCVEGSRRFPRPDGFRGSTYYGGSTYLMWSGSGWATDSCGCGTTCIAKGPNATHLPGPVYPEDATHPITVVIGGDVLPSEEWVLEGDVLYRRDSAWPAQNLNQPEGEGCTWSVTYWKGERVPSGVGRYVGTLAAELILASQGENCRLPASVRRVSRQGVSMEIDPISVVQGGLTGLLEVDRWITSVNPNRLQQPPSVI